MQHIAASHYTLQPSSLIEGRKKNEKKNDPTSVCVCVCTW